MMTAPEFENEAQALLDFARTKIPLTPALGLRYRHYDGHRLALNLPLAPNINDKGCAFGGSLACAMTLTGWALMELLLRRQGMDCEVFIASSHIRYLDPIWEDSISAAEPRSQADLERFFATLQRRGRARLAVQGEVLVANDSRAATIEASYAAKRR